MSTFGTPTQQQLGAILRCRGADLVPMMQMFETTLEGTMKSLVTATDPVMIHRLQGKAQVLKDFLELRDNADRILERLK